MASKDTWQDAQKAILESELVVIPTDTIYGICCSCFSKDAVARLNKAKQRPATKPYIILISGLKDLAKLGITPTPAQEKFLAKIWPGQFSVIFPDNQYLNTPDHLKKENLNPAIRWPDNTNLQNFLQATGPLCAPSANPAGGDPATTQKEATSYFGESVKYYVRADSEPLLSSPSTLIRLDRDANFTVIRQGSGII